MDVWMDVDECVAGGRWMEGWIGGLMGGCCLLFCGVPSLPSRRDSSNFLGINSLPGTKTQ